jgi:tubulin--tyrosine ligase
MVSCNLVLNHLEHCGISYSQAFFHSVRVLQRYISTPLTLRQRKFHIRAYIAAVGALQVYFSNDCLALLSGTKYRKSEFSQLTAHITNTAYQEIDPNFCEQECIQQWGSDIVLKMLLQDGTCQNKDEAKMRCNKVLQDMQDIVAELFTAYETEFGVFSPVEDCFEHFGLDFVIDTNWQVYLLEVNPGPGMLKVA